MKARQGILIGMISNIGSKSNPYSEIPNSSKDQQSKSSSRDTAWNRVVRLKVSKDRLGAQPRVRRLKFPFSSNTSVKAWITFSESRKS